MRIDRVERRWVAFDTEGHDDALRAAGWRRSLLYGAWGKTASWETESAVLAARFAEFVDPDLADRLARDAADEAAVAALPVLQPAEVKDGAMVAEVWIERKVLIATYAQRDDDFRAAVKGAGLRWDGETGRWQRAWAPRMGEPADRLADIAQRILGAGFPVRVRHVAAHEKAVSGEFEAEQTRWVLVGRCMRRGLDGLKVSWGPEDDLYERARALPGARYEPVSSVIVPPSAYEPVLDFAARHGFEVSPEAAARIDEARKRALNAVLVQPVRRKPKPKAAPKPSVPSWGIADALRDD